MTRTRLLLAAALIFIGAAAALFVAGVPQNILLGDARVPRPDIKASRPAPGAFPHDLLGAVQKRHVNAEGRVDYPALVEDKELARYVAAIAAHAPNNAPELFPTEADKLAFYCNAYNALVLWGVARRWPIGSVQDVESGGFVSVGEGQGFFYSLKFEIGGRWTNLYDLENTVIRGFGDARIHAAINCASVGCPRLATFAFSSDGLDAQLDEVMRAMVAEDRNVAVDDGAKSVRASSIFDWFREDFGGDDNALIDYWIRYADADKAAALKKAKEAGYTVGFVTYDWHINAQNP